MKHLKYQKDKLEKLDLVDYKVLLCALKSFEDELYHLEIEANYYEELISKLERNLEILE